MICSFSLVIARRLCARSPIRGATMQAKAGQLLKECGLSPSQLRHIEFGTEKAFLLPVTQEDGFDDCGDALKGVCLDHA